MTIPAADSAADQEAVRAVLRTEHRALLAGDSVAYCAQYIATLRLALANCNFVPAALEYQTSNKLLVTEVEFLQLTITGSIAYVSVHESIDANRRGIKTSTDYELTKSSGAWLIELGRFRTETVDGPPECFLDNQNAC